jgi:hypothetical protein
VKLKEYYLYVNTITTLTRSNLPYYLLILLLGGLYIFREISTGCGRKEIQKESEPIILTKEQIACKKYDSIYQELILRVDKIKSSFSVSHKTESDKLKEFKRNLDSTYCLSPKDITQADSIITLYDSIAQRESAIYQQAVLNGDDGFMQGVKLVSQEFRSDANFNDYAELEVVNNTNKVLASLKLGLDYCYVYNNDFNRPPPLFTCTEIIIKPITIGAMSRRTFRIQLPANMPRNPNISIIEIVRRDGIRIQTADGLRLALSRSRIN